jgi:hypothetical protein
MAPRVGRHYLRSVDRLCQEFWRENRTFCRSNCSTLAHPRGWALYDQVGSFRMAGGNTALDAIRMAVGEMRRASNPRKALLLVSDGVDNRSRYTARDIRRLISEVDFPVYTINVYERPRGNRYGIQRRDSGILEIISATTGGRTFAVRDPRKLMSVAELINSEMARVRSWLCAFESGTRWQVSPDPRRDRTFFGSSTGFPKEPVTMLHPGNG